MIRVSQNIATSMLCSLIFMTLISCMRSPEGEPSYTKANMGDYEGTWRFADGTELPLAAQVIAYDSGRFRVNILEEFNSPEMPIVILNGSQQGHEIILKGNADSGEYTGTEWNGRIANETFTGTVSGGRDAQFELSKTVRLSETLGTPPPSNAIVLFDGSSLEEWEHPQDFIGMVNLMRIVGGRQCVAYVKSEVYSSKRQEAIFEIGSDDGIKVWLNDQLVHANNVARGHEPGQDKVQVRLENGWNKIMLKITQGGGGWGASMRIVDKNGAVLGDIEEKDRDTPSEDGTRKYLEERDGYLTVWSVAGPYRKQDMKAEQLFDITFAPELAGNDTIAWQPASMEHDYSPKWRMTDGAMEVMPGSGSIVTKRKFNDVQLHVEFRSPFMPNEVGQARGNSGVYLQGRYEVQVLDSYGLTGEDNECGGVYKVARPNVNMCAPPMQWQTYDITFHAPRFDNNGEKLEHARLTVLHNGVKIHDNIEIPRPTGGELDQNLDTPGGLLLQDHGDLVQYRNIWLVEL